MGLSNALAQGDRKQQIADLEKLDNADLATIHSLSQIPGAIKKLERNKKKLLKYL